MNRWNNSEYSEIHYKELIMNNIKTTNGEIKVLSNGHIFTITGADESYDVFISPTTQEFVDTYQLTTELFKAYIDAFLGLTIPEELLAELVELKLLDEDYLETGDVGENGWKDGIKASFTTTTPLRQILSLLIPPDVLLSWDDIYYIDDSISYITDKYVYKKVGWKNAAEELKALLTTS
jgi:hypothetical protein